MYGAPDSVYAVHKKYFLGQFRTHSGNIPLVFYRIAPAPEKSLPALNFIKLLYNSSYFYRIN